MRGVISSAYPSKDFGQTPPPEDGSLVPCPKCIKGRQRAGLIHPIACPDCLGSGVQGYGFAALHVFEDWLDGLPADGDGSDGDEDDEPGH